MSSNDLDVLKDRMAEPRAIFPQQYATKLTGNSA